jgi:hypothetical protein
MKKIVTFFTGVALCKVLLPGGESFAGESNRTELRAAVQERILEANRTFHEAMTAFPEEEHAVTVSFIRALPLTKAVEKALVRGFQIEGFRHGDATHSGGYAIAPGQPLDDAMIDYEVQIPQFIDQHLTNIKRMLGSITDPELRTALQQSRREFLQQKRMYQKQGMQVIGLDLRGKGRDLERFQQTDESVRVMELRSENRRNAAILPTD